MPVNNKRNDRHVQIKAFTAWMNLHLSTRDILVKDVLHDLADGNVLNNLLELISSKKLGRWKKRCFVKIQRIENLNVALNFLEKESIRVVNIGAPDIESGNSTCILGLVWTLILRYQISGGGKKSVGKKDLSNWLKAAVGPLSDADLSNFTGAFANPQVITSMVNHLSPGALPPAKGTGKAAVREINTAMQYAEKNLGIPTLLSAEDLQQPDEQSLMLYVSYYHQASMKKYPTPEEFPTDPVNGAKPASSSPAPKRQAPKRPAPKSPDADAAKAKAEAEAKAAAAKAAADAKAKAEADARAKAAADQAKSASDRAAADKAAADKAAADKAAADKAAADKAAADRATAARLEAAAKRKAATEAGMQERANRTESRTITLTSQQQTRASRVTRTERASHLSRPSSRRGSANMVIVPTEFPKGKQCDGSHAVGPGLQGVQMEGNEDYAMVLDCEQDQDALLDQSRRMVTANNAMGMLAQKVYVDRTSKCAFTYLDWSMRYNCEFWLKEGAPKLLSKSRSKVCFEGFVSSKTWEVGVARHLNFDQGIGARQLCVYQISDYDRFITALRASVVALRSEALFSEEVYYSEASKTAIVLYEFKSKDARAKWLQAPSTAETKKAMGVTNVIRETHMDEKNKLKMARGDGQFLVLPLDAAGNRLDEQSTVNTVVKNLDTGVLEEGTLEWRTDGTCIVRYTREQASYSIDVYVNGHSIKSSPFNFRVSKVDPTKSRAEGPGLSGKCNKVCGMFFLYPRDSEGKAVQRAGSQTTDLKASVLMAGSNGPIPVSTEWDVARSAFKCQYPGPLEQGEYFIDAELDNMDVSNCPVQFTVGKGSTWQARHSIKGVPSNRHAVSAERSSCEGPGLDGSGTEFNITARTALGRPARKATALATIEGPDGMSDVTIGKNGGDGVMNASFATWPCAGRYTVNVTLGDAVVTGAPYSYIIRHVLLSEKKIAGEQVDLVERVVSVARDDGMREFRWSLTNKTDEAWQVETDFSASRNLGPLPPAMDGKVLLNSVAQAGQTVVFATLMQEHPGESFVTTEDLKWTSTASPCPQLDAMQSFAEGLGLTGNQGAGIAPEGFLPFVVHARDTKNRPTNSGEISVKMMGLMGEVPVEVGRSADVEGQYECRYSNLTSVGYYSLEIRLNNKHIPSSPFQFLVTRLKQGDSEIDGANIHETIYQLGFEDDCVGFEWTVTNNERDAWLLVYDFEGTENLAPLPEHGVTESRLEAGASQIIHQVKQEDPDENFHLRAKAHAHEIQRLQPLACFAEGQGLAPNGTQDDTLLFSITPVDTKKRCMSLWVGPEEHGHPAEELSSAVTLTGPPSMLRDAAGRARRKPPIDKAVLSDVPVTVVRQDDGTYAASYKQLTTVGVYTLDIKLGGEHIKDSPMEFVVKRRLVVERRLQDGLELWERIYEVYNELGLISWDFELENKTEDEYVTNHDFTGSKNIGDVSEPVMTELLPGSNNLMCTKLQVDPTKDAAYEYKVTFDERCAVDIQKSIADGPALDGNQGSGFSPEEPMESEGSDIPLFFKRKGEGEAVDAAQLLPLEFEVRIVDVKGRKCAKFAEVCATLEGPNGADIEVTVGDNVDGTVKCSYPALLVSGQYSLAITINDEHTNGSPTTFMVSKVAQQMKPIETSVGDGGLYEVVYSLGREDGLLSLQWELVNKCAADTWLVTHDFTGTVNMGELPEDNRFETEVGAGATGVVCMLTQLDANAEISPVWALVTDEKNPIDCEASFLDGEGVTGNGGLGRPSKAADAAEGEGKADEPLEFVIHALNTQGRLMAKFVEATATLEGPDGKGGRKPIAVTVGENEGGLFQCSYPPCEFAGMYELNVALNGSPVKQSPCRFLVEKIQDEHNQLWKKKDIWENVYQIGREDGLLSWQWEMVNQTDKTWMVHHDFNDEANDNLGVLPADRKYLTEVPSGATVVVCTLVQQDRSKPAGHCAMANVFEAGRYQALVDSEKHMPACKEDLAKAMGALEVTGSEFVLFVKHWDDDNMTMAASPWAKMKMAEELKKDADESNPTFHAVSKAWLTPEHTEGHCHLDCDNSCAIHCHKYNH